VAGNIPFVGLSKPHMVNLSERLAAETNTLLKQQSAASAPDKSPDEIRLAHGGLIKGQVG
jgi:hypothetical protein